LKRNLVLSFLLLFCFAFGQGVRGQSTLLQGSRNGNSDSHLNSIVTNGMNCNPGASCRPVISNLNTQSPNRFKNPPPPTVQNGNSALGVSYNNTACGLNYVQASVLIEQRSVPYSFNANGSGLPSQVTITGLPACFVVDKAFLWFTASYYSALPPASPGVNITNPSSVMNAYSASLIGQDGPKCWQVTGEQGSAVWRTDVSSNISGNGVYSFNITGFTNGGNEIDGATLMIIYRDPSVGYQGTLVIYDGCWTCGSNNSYFNNTFLASQTMTGFTACGPSTYANAFLVGSDFQSNVNGGVHTDSLNGTVNTNFLNIFYNFDVANGTVANGQSSATCSVYDPGDCYCISLTGIYFQTTGCVTCTNPTALNVTTATTPATCGACNGLAGANVTSGGVAPYSYVWSNGQTTQLATGLCAGPVYVTITDAGCDRLVDTVNITVSGGVTANIVASVNATCAGVCNASATVSASGGVPPYTYLWSSVNQTSQAASGLCAGNYTVTLTDANQCSSTVTVTITSPLVLSATTANTNVLCNGGNNASAVTTATGGTAPFNYLWSNGQATSTTSSLTAGTYTVTITDANNCTSTASVTITEPQVLTSVAVNTNVLCNGGNTGTAAVSASGGTAPVTYLWSNGQQTQIATPLTAGTYTVTITDANNCTTTSSITVTEPTLLTSTLLNTNVLCNGGNSGSAAINASGGTSPVTYLWSNGQQTQVATPLSAGIYTVTITDANNCTTTNSVTITEPMVLTSTASNTNVLCNGGNTGNATVSTTGGTAPISYLWNNGQTSAIASSLIAGTYIVLITDANNCTTTSSVTVTQPTALSVTPSNTNNVCHGGNTANANVTVAGGTSGYTYNWSNGVATSSVSNLMAGHYTVTVADANGCTITAVAIITEPAAVVANIQASQNVLCNGQCNGSSTASVSGGSGPYNYLWSNGQVTAGISAVCAGNYTVTVTDANNCPAVTSVIINEPPILLSSIPAVNPICDGETTNASVVAIGGAPMYSYAWSNGQHSNTITIGAGMPTFYTVTVTDANGCIDTASVTIVVNPTPFVDAGRDTTILAGTSIMLSATGSTGLYSWSPTTALSSPNSSTPIANPEKTITYIVYVTDIDGCRNQDTITIYVEDYLTLYIPSAFTPGDSKNNIFYAYGIGISDFEFYIFDRWGTLVFESKDPGVGWDGTFKGQVVPQDVYVYLAKAKSVTGKSITKTGSITMIGGKQ